MPDNSDFNIANYPLIVDDKTPSQFVEDKNITDSFDKINEALVDVLDVLSTEAQKEPVKVLREIIDSPSPDTELIEETATVTVDTLTGKMSVVNEDEDLNETEPIPLEDITSEMILNSDDLARAAKNNLAEFKLDDAEVLEMIKLIERYKAGDNFSVYNALPQKMKTSILNQASSMGVFDQSKINFMAKTMMETFIDEMKMDNAYIDFEKSLKETLAIPSIVDLYSNYIREVMEDKLLEKVAKLEEFGEADKAASLQKVSEAFTDTYTFRRVFEFLSRPSRPLTRLPKDIVNYNKFYSDFIYKFKESKFKIPDLKDIIPVMQKKFPEQSMDKLKMFSNMLWHTFSELDATNIADNSYIYFTLKNIIILAFVDEDKTEYSQQIIDNINRVFDIFDTLIKNREERITHVSKKHSRYIQIN